MRPGLARQLLAVVLLLALAASPGCDGTGGAGTEDARPPQHDRPLPDGLARDGGPPVPDGTGHDATDAAPPLPSGCSLDGWCWEEPLPQGNTLNAVANFGSQAWAAGDHGTILHWDGKSWTAQRSGVAVDLLGLWGAAASDLWAVGRKGTILHWDGSTWSQTASPTTDDLTAVHGTSASEVLAASAPGRMIGWDGAKWVERGWLGGSAERLFATGPRDYWAVSELSVSRGDGDTWQRLIEFRGHMPPRFGSGICGTSASDVWVVGSGVLLHWDGSAWTESKTEGEWWLTDCVAFAPDSVYAVGAAGVVARWSGGPKWTEETREPYVMLRALSGPSAQELWAVGDAGALVSSSDWSSMSRYAQGTMSSVHGSSKDNLWAVGSSGVMRRSGMLWEGVADAPGSSIWTSGLADVWVVGDGFIHHWNGIEWEDRCPQYDKYQGVWGSSPTDVYVVGSKEALRWDGTQWTELAVVSRARPNLLAVHGDGAGHIWAVGAEGHAFSWDGQAFVPEPLDKTEYLTSVWVLGENDVWAASQFFDVHDRIDSGHVHHWDGARWEVRYTVAGRLWAIWARSSNDVFAVGERGLVVHWDGTTWTEMEAGTGEDLHGLWGTAEDGPWAVGDNRAILRYAGTRADRDSRTSLPELGMHSTRSLARLSVPFELLGEEGDVGQRLVRGLAVGGG